MDWTGSERGPPLLCKYNRHLASRRKEVAQSTGLHKSGLTSGLKYEVLIMLSLRFKGFVFFGVDGAETIFFQIPIR